MLKKALVQCINVCVILDTGVELELDDCMPFLEWLANNYKQFGATLEIITDRSQEGSQVWSLTLCLFCFFCVKSHEDEQLMPTLDVCFISGLQKVHNLYAVACFIYSDP